MRNPVIRILLIIVHVLILITMFRHRNAIPIQLLYFFAAVCIIDIPVLLLIKSPKQKAQKNVKSRLR